MTPPAFLHPFARPAAERFVTMVRGRGALVWDDTGKEYVDALASLWYCQIGHGRPEVADAVDRQLRTLEAFHTFELFTNEPAEAFTTALARLAPMPGARVFLTSSGSEAVDTAIKLVRHTFALAGRPERRIVVSRDRAYHGVTIGGTSAQGLAPNREHFGPLLHDVVQVAPDDLAELDALLADRGDEVAAVVAEPVQGAGGVRVPPAGYLRALRQRCDDHGALLVLDEVITGFGRLGRWWGAEVAGVEPDLVIFAKGATSGYLPLGGVLVGRRVLDVLEADVDRVLRHGFTYSGHPASCAAGVANLAVLEAEDLPARAGHIGDVLGTGLARLVDDGLAVECRGIAGMWAIDLPPGTPSSSTRDRMLELGVIPRPIGDATLAFCPPLVITDAQLERVLEVTEAALRR